MVKDHSIHGIDLEVREEAQEEDFSFLLFLIF
jgi:hypothetical protein